MSDKDERRFAEALVNDLASEVLEDEAECDEALKLGADPDAVIARIQEAANRAIAERRRARIAALGQQERHASVAAERKYSDLSREDMMRLVHERQAAVEHRDLTDVPDEDLQTLLEDLDAIASGGKGK